MKHNEIIVLNSAFALTEDQTAQIKAPPIWARIAPAAGEKSGLTKDGTLVLQKFSPESNARVVLNFSPEVLVDREHSSELSSDTTAMAWIDKLDARQDGLYACFNCTDLGWEALRNRRLRFPSAVFFLDPDGFPTALKSCAFTNKHNLKMLSPILNKDADASSATARIADTRATATGPAPQQEGEQMDKKLLAMLGLADNADAPAVLNAVQSIVATRDELATKLKTLETAALNKEADAFVAKHASKIKDPARIKNLYVLNKDIAEQFVGAIADVPAPAHQVINREDGKPPVVLNVEADAEKARKRDSLVDRIARDRNCTHVAAMAFARNEDPTLF
jgi:hypothetical protein